MALSAFESQFASALVKAEDPGSTTAAEAAQKFADAFINFFANAQVNGMLPNMAVLQSPAAVNALVGGLTSAFKATGGPTAVCDLMEAAFFAFWNAGPLQAMFSTVVPSIASIAPGGPLSSNMSSISSPDPSQNSAKAKVAAAISTWLTTQPTIAISPPPPGVTTKFV